MSGEEHVLCIYKIHRAISRHKIFEKDDDTDT